MYRAVLAVFAPRVNVSFDMALGQVRLAHRVAELENLPYGLSAKAPVIKVTASDVFF